MKRNRRFEQLVEMGCIACEFEGYANTPPEIHHIRQGYGLSQRAPDSETIPLCPIHHRTGKGRYPGFHSDKTNFIERYGTERELLATVDARMTNSRTKGRAGEQEVARILRDELGLDIHRNWQEQAVRGGVDLIGVPFWAIEVKRAKKYLAEWWIQAAEQAQKASEKPVLIFKLDRHSWRARVCYCALNSESELHFQIEMELTDWCSIVRENLCLSEKDAPVAISSST